MILKYLLLLPILLLPGCIKQSTQEVPHVIRECFTTTYQNGFNVDSVAIWHGNNNQDWLIATAKTAHTLPVYDATTGKLIKTIGNPGKQPGQLQRPNGIAVLDDFLFIVERDNKRLQVFDLPSGRSIGMMQDLELPYVSRAIRLKKVKNICSM